MKIFRYHYVFPFSISGLGVSFRRQHVVVLEVISKEKDGPTTQCLPLSEFIL